MTEHLESDSTSTPPRESDVIALLKKLQQQMVFLEKKLDLLISQKDAAPAMSQPSGERSFDRPSFKDRHFSKPPFRSYGPPRDGGGFRGDRDRGPRQDRGDRGDRPSGPPRGGFSSGRPSYGGGRPRRDDRNGPPSGGPGGGSGFGGPKKPFYRGRKDRD